MQNKFAKRVATACLSAAVAATTLLAPGLKPSAVQAATTDNYARLLQYSLYFYDANMCGSDVQSKGGMEWRGNCHTSDDVTGGFHDAGDHAMFGLPQGYTAAALGLSYYEFKDAYEATGQADHIKMILDHFCTYFRNSTKLSGDTVSNFLYQKGDGKEDHSYWGRPEDQGGRKMFWTSNGASDIAANYAAALAINYKNFGNADDLKYAKALYNFSKQYNQCATDGPKGFYNSSSCADEQAMAAGALALATGEDTYKQAVKNVNALEVHWAYGWNDANLGAAVMNGIVNSDWNAATGYLGSLCNGSNYLFMDKWGSARLNCSMQFMALVATKEKQGSYTDWAKGQMNYILGQNPANTCFVTGFASNSAKNAHHRAASGYTSYEQFNMNGWNPDGDHMSPFCEYGSNAKPLIGALVGGPCNANGDYHDNMADYVCNEVAIDYNAGLVGAAAGLYYFTNSGSTDSTINGVTKIYSGSSSITSTASTQGSSSTSSSTTSSTSSTSSTTGEAGKYTLTVGDSYTIDGLAALPEDERMIAFPYEDFGLTASSTEKITKVEVQVTSKNGNLGTYVGSFGTSTTDSANGYWYMVKPDINKTLSGTTDKITWEPSSDVASIIQYGYGGSLKIGFWWLDCKSFTIDSVTIYTDGKAAVSSSSSTSSTTSSSTTSSTTSSSTTSSTTSSSTTSTQTGSHVPGDADCNGAFDLPDCVLVAKAAAGAQQLSTQGRINADVDGVAGIGLGDLKKMLQAIAGSTTL